jgi:predicted TIM-barrel fold metal-dependent hydrolase
MHVDVHQHLWTEPLLDALAVRDAPPFVRRTHGVTVLHLAGEQPYVVDTEVETPVRRAQLVHEDGLDLAAIALSSPIGVEALPREEASALIGAYLAGVAELPEEFLAWGPVALDRLDPADVDRLLERGCVGISLPATALAGREALDRSSPLLRRAAERGAPVFVHPGPIRNRGGHYLDEPLWWSALTEYVAQMQAAWLTFAALGRAEHPDLVVLFAMLAGGAPLLSERLNARGGPPIDLRDPFVFYDTSSYGPSAVEGMARRVGATQLVYGSDRPVVEPMPTGREALLAENGGRLLARPAKRMVAAPGAWA